MNLRAGLFAVLCTLIAGPASAQELLRLGTDGDFPPNAFINAAGALDGLEPELATRLCPDAGFRCEWVILPFGELEPALQEGRIDAIMAGLANTAERKQRMLFTTPYFEPGENLVIALAARDIPENLTDLRIAALAGSMQAEMVEGLGATLVTSDSQEGVWEKLRSGEADALIGSTHWLTSHDLTGTIAIGAPIPDPAAAAIAFRLDDTERAAAITRALEALAREGYLGTLRDKWFGPKTDT